MANTKQANQEDLLDDTFGEHSEEQEEEKPTPPAEEEGEETPPEESEEEGSDEEGDVEEEIASFFNDTDSEGAEEEEMPPEEEEEQEEDEPESIDDILSLDEDTFDEMTANPEQFSALLKKVYEKGLKDTMDTARQEIANAKEEILRNIPEVVGKATKRAQSVQQTTKQFFTDFPELKEKQGYVKDMTNRVSTQNPDWTASQVLQEVGKRAKRDLGISAKAEKREKERGNPKFAGAGGRRAPGGGEDKRTKQEKLLDDTFAGS